MAAGACRSVHLEPSSAGRSPPGWSGIYVYTWMYGWMDACMYVHTYTHTHTHTHRRTFRQSPQTAALAIWNGCADLMDSV